MSNPFVIPPRTKTVEFLPGDAERELQELRAQLLAAIDKMDAAQPGPRRAGQQPDSEVRRIGRQIEELRATWAGREIRFTLREVPRDDYVDDGGEERPGITSLLERHSPAEETKDPSALAEAQRALNRDLVWEALVEPKGTREQYDQARWSKPVWDQLAATAAELSQELAVLPKFSIDSVLRELSDSESKPQPGSE